MKVWWHERLSGELPALNLPTDFPRPPVMRYRGKYVGFGLPGTLDSALRYLVRNRKTGMFATVLALVKVLLYLYTGETDIIVGTPVAGRIRPETEDQIGCYLNTLALRDRISPEESFLSFLKKVAGNAAEAYDRQFYPFDRQADELATERNLSRHHLFDVMVFEVLVDDDTLLELGDTETIPVRDITVRSRFDIGFSFLLRDDGIRFGIEYNSDLFREDTITRLRDHFTELVRDVTAFPEKSVGELNLLTPAELYQILVRWNDTKTDCPADISIH